MNRKYIYILMAACFINIDSYAQKNLSEEVNVVRQYKPILAEALKINTNPEIKVEDQGKENPSYTFSKHRVDSTLKINAVQVEKMKNESISKLYNYYVRMGGGNYRTSYLEAWANNLRSKEWVLGAHYRHQAQVGSIKNMAYSDNTIDAYAKRIYAKQSMSLAMIYDRDVNHFYGYDHSLFNYEASKVRQNYQLFGIQSNVNSNSQAYNNFAYQGNFDFYTVKDRYNANENRFALGTDLMYKEFKANLGVDIATYEDSLTAKNNLFFIEPRLKLKEAGINFEIGANIYQEFGNNSNFHIYPHVSANYNLSTIDAVVYASLSGRMKKNSLRDFYQENPFIGDNIRIFNTNEKINLTAGIRGKIDVKNTYQINIQHQSLSRAAYFVARNDAYRTYDVLYDGPDAAQTHISLQYNHVSSEKLRIFAGMDYTIFKLDTIQYAWHRPTSIVRLGSTYNIANKFLIDAELYSYSKMKGREINGTAKTIKGGVDLNLGIDYRYSKIISVYLNLNNLLSYKRETFNYYTGLGFQAMLGASFRF